MLVDHAKNDMLTSNVAPDPLPRSLNLNTEIGLMIDSPELARQVVARFDAIAQPANAREELRRVGFTRRRKVHQPPAASVLRLAVGSDHVP